MSSGHHSHSLRRSEEEIAACSQAAIAQLGERQTEDLEVPGSIPGLGILYFEQVNFAVLFASNSHMSQNFRVRELNPGHLRDRQIY